MDNSVLLFSELTPDLILEAAEKFTGSHFDGTIFPYNSYVNRVFGITDDDDNDFVIKFYRPGRWTVDSILDEHCFLLDCAESEVPVVSPLRYSGTADVSVSTTLGQISGLYFALFPRLRARTFDIYNDDDWIRTGRAVGRMHLAAEKRISLNRLQCSPQQTTENYIRLMLREKLVTPELVRSFTEVCDRALDYIEDEYTSLFGEPDENGLYHTPLFHRIHGDCHRGNILEQFLSSSENSIITLIDFDDMMTGPAIQDLWLLLPGLRADSMRELNLLLEGYTEFAGDSAEIEIRRQIRLIEPLRFMRNIYFLAWTGIQHKDTGFLARNPGWGTKAFWEREIESLNTQLEVLKEEYDTQIT